MRCMSEAATFGEDRDKAVLTVAGSELLAMVVHVEVS
jgi:hypothetical protein